MSYALGFKAYTVWFDGRLRLNSFMLTLDDKGRTSDSFMLYGTEWESVYANCIAQELLRSLRWPERYAWRKGYRSEWLMAYVVWLSLGVQSAEWLKNYSFWDVSYACLRAEVHLVSVIVRLRGKVLTLSRLTFTPNLVQSYADSAERYVWDRLMFTLSDGDCTPEYLNGNTEWRERYFWIERDQLHWSQLRLTTE